MAKKKKQDNTKKEDPFYLVSKKGLFFSPDVLDDEEKHSDPGGAGWLYIEKNVSFDDQKDIFTIFPPQEWVDEYNSGEWVIRAKELKRKNCIAKLHSAKYRTRIVSISKDLKELLISRGFTSLFTETKLQTKPKGSNPAIIERNKKIQKEYFHLQNKYNSKRALETLSKKYKLSSETIKTILKKTWD